jgi:DNA replication protein DnaC
MNEIDQLQLLREAEHRRAQREFQTTIPEPIGNDVAIRMAELEAKFKANPLPQSKISDHEREQKLQALTKAAGIPRRHSERNEFKNEHWRQKLESLRAKLGSGFLIALIGIRGCGKTQMAVELIRAQIQRLKSAHLTTAMDIFLDIKSAYRKGSEIDERQILNRFFEPRLLVIDEIQERAETAWEDRILTHLVDRRYKDERDTILVGNSTREKFEKEMGASIVSRLNETGGIIVCDWESFRR